MVRLRPCQFALIGGFVKDDGRVRRFSSFIRRIWGQIVVTLPGILRHRRGTRSSVTDFRHRQPASGYVLRVAQTVRCEVRMRPYMSPPRSDSKERRLDALPLERHLSTPLRSDSKMSPVTGSTSTFSAFQHHYGTIEREHISNFMELDIHLSTPQRSD